MKVFGVRRNDEHRERPALMGWLPLLRMGLEAPAGRPNR
jgi:hypothetical protein